MISSLIITGLAFLLIGISLWLIIFLKKKAFGILSKRYVYSDAGVYPGEVFYSDILQLKGKPDYIIKSGKSYIPVEIKTGKTPRVPYRNHTMQVIAYCALVEETFKTTVPYGIIKYPEAEFKIEFTTRRKTALITTIEEIQTCKTEDNEPKCYHPYHQL